MFFQAYRERKGPELPIRALQWYPTGVVKLASVLPLDPYGEEKKMCACGKPLSYHGSLVGIEICPGDWIVKKGRTITIWPDSAFKEAFSPVLPDPQEEKY